MLFLLKNFIKRNLLFQYSIVSFLITVVIGISIIYFLVDISQDSSIRQHSAFYFDFIDSIPDNFPEIIPSLENGVIFDEHDFEHFLTDLRLYPTFSKIAIYTREGKHLWNYRESSSKDLSYDMSMMMDKALRGDFAYHILRDGNSIVLHTFYPIKIGNKNLGVIEISDIDTKTGFSLDESQQAIIRIVMVGGSLFYILLFFLFYRSYKTQVNAFNRLNQSQQLTLYSMSLLAELRDNDTGSHILRTKAYCRLLAEELKKKHKYKKYITHEYIEDIERSAPLHDIGKVGISDSILLKPGKLTVEEFKVIQTHPTLGAEVLKRASETIDFQSFFEIGIQIALCHHENWDGSGYPNGLKGNDIPLSARIMAVADVYDALRTVRPYKKPLSHEVSVQIIIEDSNKKFDPEIIEVFKLIEGKFDEISSDIF